MALIGFIGMGNMGSALLKGALKVFEPGELLFTARTEETKLRVTTETGVPYAASNAECANSCKYIVLAVKPQCYDSILKQIHYVVKPEQIVISLAPGITGQQLKERLGSECRIVRAMPNTAAGIGKSMTALSYSEEEILPEEAEVLQRLFGAAGRYEKVEEHLMSAVVAASGSSPAFVYMFVEALADGAVKCGLSREQAYTFAAQAVSGAAEMILETGEHPAVLKDRVCSPGGTTIEGVRILESAGFRSAIMEACAAVFEKSEKMG